MPASLYLLHPNTTSCMLQVQRHPHNVEAWRMLGTVQAENDDDTQAIAALNRALQADPDNAEASM